MKKIIVMFLIGLFFLIVHKTHSMSLIIKSWTKEITQTPLIIGLREIDLIAWQIVKNTD